MILTTWEPNSPVAILILHRGEMALHSQQHLHVPCDCVVEEGVGMALGELQGLLQEQVVCSAGRTVM